MGVGEGLMGVGEGLMGARFYVRGERVRRDWKLRNEQCE